MTRVLATDLDNERILELLRRNVKRNSPLYRGTVTVQALDFNQCLDTMQEYCDVELVIAGDVIYDNEITEHFVDFMVRMHDLKKLHKSSDHTEFIVAMEKRFVFTLDDLDTVAPAYDYFVNLLDPEVFYTKYDQKRHKISVNYSSLDFPQHFCYERTHELVIISVIMSTPHSSSES